MTLNNQFMILLNKLLMLISCKRMGQARNWENKIIQLYVVNAFCIKILYQIFTNRIAAKNAQNVNNKRSRYHCRIVIIERRRIY